MPCSKRADMYKKYFEKRAAEKPQTLTASEQISMIANLFSFYGVTDGIRTHDLQGHNLAL